ncbi:MAG: outer membrane protein assembly factor BamD [Chthoniobacterales bacterium]|nr:outer membrane protein assembly factor BamD [Chthoniobacterales bacterium]
MSYRFRLLCLLAAAGVAFPQRSPAPVVFKPGENVKYHSPGEEEISGNAEQLFQKGQQAERDGNTGRALKAYRTLVKKHPQSTLAAGALFRYAKVLESRGDLIKAAQSYRALMEFYPKTEHFTEAIEAQFRIGELYVNGKKVKFLGVPLATSMDDAVEIFAAIVRSAPYGSYTARAQFDIGRAREKQGAGDLAITAFQAVVEKFPNDPLAVDAQYQIGYIWLKAASGGSYDPNATEQARTAFQDFLFRFPKSEKAPQAQENLRRLDQRQVGSSLSVAQFYDRKKEYRAAVIYYNEVIRQQPGSASSALAKKRIDQLRAKYGDARLQSAATVAEAQARKNPKKPIAAASPAALPPHEEREPARPEMRADPNELAPLPPSADSLPPPAASGASAFPDASATPEPTPTPEPSGTP